MCLRRALGLFVACTVLVAYGLGTIGCIILLVNKNAPHLDQTVVIELLVVCSIMTLTSALLVVGIIKRRRRYMRPWLLLTALIIVLGFILALIGLFSGGNRMARIISFVASTGIQQLLLYPIYKLYQEMRDEYAEITGET